MLQLIILTILFNITAGKLVKYTPETFNVKLQSGVMYHVTKEISSCPQKALIEQTVSFRYVVLLVQGEDVTEIETNTKIEHSVTMILGSNEKYVPQGKFWL